MNKNREIETYLASDLFRRLTTNAKTDRGSGQVFRQAARLNLLLRAHAVDSPRRLKRMDTLECWPRGYPTHDDL
jgi:hypothetical protein